MPTFPYSSNDTHANGSANSLTRSAQADQREHRSQPIGPIGVESMPFLEGPACPLWTEFLGTGGPVTVFAHGITGSHDELRPLAAGTSGTRVLMDFRGHGYSGTPPVEDGYDHHAMAADLDTVAQATGATQVFGTSMGAGAILRLLTENPSRFERVALLLPASIDGPNPVAQEYFPPLADLLETCEINEVVARTLADPSQQPLFEKRPYWRKLVRERTLRMNGVGVPRALRAYLSGAPPVDDVALLSRVTIPVLIFAHEGDGIHDVAHARRLHSLLPASTLRVWDEPLSMFDDQPAFARLIGDFFNVGHTDGFSGDLTDGAWR